MTVHNFLAYWVFAIVTLEDGTRGVGESTLIGTELAVATIIELWGRRLIGQSVLDASAIQARLQRESYWLTRPVMSAAFSALDVALWDAKARALGVPVHVQLGGRARKGVPSMATAGSSAPERHRNSPQRPRRQSTGASGRSSGLRSAPPTGA